MIDYFLIFLLDSFLTSILEVGLRWNRKYVAAWLTGDAKVGADFHSHLSTSCENGGQLMQEPVRSD